MKNVLSNSIKTPFHLSVPVRREPRTDDEELDRAADPLALAADRAGLQGGRRQHDRRQAADGGGRVRPRRARLGTDVGAAKDMIAEEEKGG